MNKNKCNKLDKKELEQKKIINMTEQELVKFASENAEEFVQEIIRTAGLVSRCGFRSSEEGIEKANEIAQQMLSELAPKTGAEAMLAAQMISTHHLQQKCSYLASNMSYPQHVQPYVSMMAKLSNSFVSQLQMLSKLQNKTQQTVRVERVNINSGANAIIGDVHQRGDKNDEE